MTEDYPSDWGSRREKVLQRDNHQCQNCGQRSNNDGEVVLNAHHIVPKSKGGSHRESNLITLCGGCHRAIHAKQQAPTSDAQQQNRKEIVQDIAKQIGKEIDRIRRLMQTSIRRALVIDDEVPEVPIDTAIDGRKRVRQIQADITANRRIITSHFLKDSTTVLKRMDRFYSQVSAIDEINDEASDMAVRRYIDDRVMPAFDSLYASLTEVRANSEYVSPKPLKPFTGRYSIERYSDDSSDAKSTASQSSTTSLSAEACGRYPVLGELSNTFGTLSKANLASYINNQSADSTLLRLFREVLEVLEYDSKLASEDAFHDIEATKANRLLLTKAFYQETIDEIDKELCKSLSTKDRVTSVFIITLDAEFVPQIAGERWGDSVRHIDQTDLHELVVGAISRLSD